MQKYAFQILEKFGDKEPDNENQNNFMEKMKEDGFTVVLNNHGSVNFNKKPNLALEEKPQKMKFLDNFYKFQNQAKGSL